jgi:hypothetical protein
MNIIQVPTKDFTKGRGGKKLQYIVMHWGVTNKIDQIDAEVLNPNRQMSYTYALSDLKVHQYVSEDNTAWHAGVFDINQRSIGICINASPTNPYTDQDYETASQLIADIFRRRGRLEIKAHRDFKATACPGTLDFGRLQRRIDDILTPPAPTPNPVPPTPVVVLEVNETPPVVDITPPEVNNNPVDVNIDVKPEPVIPNNPPEDVKVPVVEQVPEKPLESTGWTYTGNSEPKLTWWGKVILFIIKWIGR